MPTNPMSYKVGDTIDQRYRIHRVMRGGMGEVYLCVDTVENIPLALKTFQRPQTNQPLKIIQSFEQEVEKWISFGYHPNIVFCFWMRQLDRRPFLALEWVQDTTGRGTSLREWLFGSGIPIKQALTFIIHICRGLKYATEKVPGLVHRDLKPDNILIDAQQRAKITDFGLAIIHNPDALANNEGVAGTPFYMAPEQWVNPSAIDGRTDQYAIGCILYELLADQPPFRAQTVSQLRQAHLNQLPDLQKIPQQLRVIVAKCMEKILDNRYATIQDLLNALEIAYKELFGHTIEPVGDIEDDLIDPINRGLTYAELGMYEQALADFGRALKNKDDALMAYINRAHVYLLMKDYPKAEADIQRVLNIAPDNVLIYINQAKLYSELNRHNEAIGACNVVLKQQPDNPQALYNRGLSYYAQGNHQKALNDFSKALQINPRLVEAYGNRAVIYAINKQYDQALRDWDAALALNPYHVRSLTERAKVYLELKRIDKALAGFSLALEITPDDSEIYYNRGVIHHSQSDILAALDDWEKAVELNPRDYRAQFNLGVLLYRTGWPTFAKKHLETAQQLGFDGAGVYLQIIDQMLGQLGKDAEPPDVAVVFIFNAQRKDDLREQLTYMPFITGANFIDFLKPFIASYDPGTQRELARRFNWLQELARENC